MSTEAAHTSMEPVPEEAEQDKRARWAIHDIIWASSEQGEHRRMTWEEAQEAGDRLYALGYRVQLQGAEEVLQGQVVADAS